MFLVNYIFYVLCSYFCDKVNKVYVKQNTRVQVMTTICFNSIGTFCLVRQYIVSYIGYLLYSDIFIVELCYYI